MKKLRIYFLSIFLLAFLAVASAQEEKMEDVFLYKAIPGDSLWNITERHLSSINLWKKLKKINNLPDSDFIEPGTIIKIPREWLKTNTSTATLVNAIGEVTIKSVNGESIQLGKDFEADGNLVLTEGQVITTGPDGLATILFKDGSRLLLQSNSELALKNIIALGDGSLSDIKLQLDKGRIENRVYSSPISNTNYEVKTATATTSVRGTSFRMTSDDSGESITEVLTGKVKSQALSASESIELVKGEATIITKEGNATKVKLLPPPVFKSMPQIVEHVPIRIEVEQQEGISGYSSVIVPVGKDEKDAVSSHRSKGNVIEGDDLPDGRYQLFVSSISDDGVTGEPAQYEFILNARPFYPTMTTPSDEQKLLGKDLVFNWKKANDDSAKYHFQVAKDDKFRELVINDDNVTQETYTPSEQLLSGYYHWRLAAIDKTGKRGPFTASQSFRVLLEDPNLTNASVKTSDMNLTWDASEEGTVFKLQISKSQTFDDVVFEKELTENSILVEDMIPGVYYFRIQTTGPDQFVGEWGLPNSFEVPNNDKVSEKLK